MSDVVCGNIRWIYSSYKMYDICSFVFYYYYCIIDGMWWEDVPRNCLFMIESSFDKGTSKKITSRMKKKRRHVKLKFAS